MDEQNEHLTFGVHNLQNKPQFDFTQTFRNDVDFDHNIQDNPYENIDLDCRYFDTQNSLIILFLRIVFVESAKRIVTDVSIAMMNFLIPKMKAKVDVEIKKISNTLQVSCHLKSVAI